MIGLNFIKFQINFDLVLKNFNKIYLCKTAAQDALNFYQKRLKFRKISASQR